jgi:hypothetical protein
MIAATVISWFSPMPAFAEDFKIARKADRVSLFEVNLRCEAAPEIGCGSRSKPILLELERDSIIAEAWLNGAGTVLAIVGTEQSSRESRAKVVQTTLEKNGVTGTELDGESREIVLKNFLSANGWFHSTEVDNLSRQEAKTIAVRLVRRIAATVELPEEKSKALEMGIATAFEHRFTGNHDSSDATCKRDQLADELLKVAEENLDQKGIGAFQAAFAKGIRPTVDDKEERKIDTTVPNCCSTKTLR